MQNYTHKLLGQTITDLLYKCIHVLRIQQTNIINYINKQNVRVRRYLLHEYHQGGHLLGITNLSDMSGKITSGVGTPPFFFG